jgi:hypothetical protein
LTAKLKTLNAGDLVAFFTWDEPIRNVVDNIAFKTELAKFGANLDLFSGAVIRSSYFLLAHKFGHKYEEGFKTVSSTIINQSSVIKVESNSLFGRYNTENWTTYSNERISTTMKIEAGYGFKNLPDAVWTITVIDEESDWDNYPKAKAAFYQTEN